jgi:hypothetical protein
VILRFFALFRCGAGFGRPWPSAWRIAMSATVGGVDQLTHRQVAMRLIMLGGRQLRDILVGLA